MQLFQSHTFGLAVVGEMSGVGAVPAIGGTGRIRPIIRSGQEWLNSGVNVGMYSNPMDALG